MQLETVSGEMEELELEAHHILLNDKWRQLFDKFDNEGFGEIPWDDFLVALESPDFQECIEPSKREVLASKAREHRTYAITFDDFVAVKQFDDDEIEKAIRGHQSDVQRYNISNILHSLPSACMCHRRP
ncbi:uncharacterized protein NPIL_328581 [Nephila pilipes]|uniref:EF-hand domain-containing protein n=1 Tax=Nephila pilipes TaxID=299642 RepID=A0A8X6U0R9_NEPPI|nr:uncharacterized protein NPIL_328581 [Nephila pilipes]